MRRTQEVVDSDSDDDDGGGGMKWRIDPWGLPTSRGRSPPSFPNVELEQQKLSL